MISDEKKLNMLVAYPYMNKATTEIIKQNQDSIRFLLDSGAFTAWKSGKEIKIDDYCRFIEELPVKPWRYFMLDKIGDPEGTAKNYEIMLERGFSPIPIFTRGEDFAVLEHYYKTSDVVGIGGLVGTQQNKGYINGIMEKVGNRKVHWLGFTKTNYIKHYRPYMCDSSNYSRGSRYGLIDAYAGNGVMLGLTRSSIRNKEKEIESAIKRAMRYGFDIRRLANKEEWHGEIAKLMPSYSWVDYSLDCKKNLGTHLFLAASGAQAIEVILKAHKTILTLYR